MLFACAAGFTLLSESLFDDVDEHMDGRSHALSDDEQMLIEAAADVYLDLIRVRARPWVIIL